MLTKLHIPTTAENLVSRKDLFDQLDEGLNRKLILVSAPAGYGKTTILTQWIEKQHIPTAWFSIDARDNSPYDFFTFLTRSLQTVETDVGKKALELLKLPGTVGLDYIIELLINDLLKIEKDVLLVLDDFHLIHNEQVFKSIAFLLEFKPKQFHIAVLTRSDPSLPIARLRSQNEVMEIRASDLSFSMKETSELFNKKLNLGVDSADIQRLDQKMEGWIAGLQLVALTIQDKKNKSEYIAKIAGDSRYIMDYLIEEVLDIHDKEKRTFLLFTSILEKLHGSLCDSVLQIDNGQFLLESLEKNNTFIVPLDHEREWYRYHHLFADLLRKQLIVFHKEEVVELHRRASSWFEQNDMPLLAIEHALAAEDKEEAMLKINAIIDELWEKSQVAVILKFGRLFHEEEIVANKNFAIIYAWCLIAIGELKTAQYYLHHLEKSTKDKKLLGRIYETLNLSKVFSGDVGAAFKYSQLAIQHIPDDDIQWKSWAYISNGESHLLRFELIQCIESFKKATENTTKSNRLGVKMVADSKMAYALRLTGRYHEAYRICKDLLKDISEDHSIEESRANILSSMLYATIGLIQIERNYIEEGLKNAILGFEFSRNVTSLSFKGYGALLMAESLSKIGRLDQALQTIEDLEAILERNAVQWLSVLAYSLKSKLLIQRGDIKNAGILHRQIIKEDRNHAFEKYFNNIAFARLLVAQYNFPKAIDLINELAKGLERDQGIELLIEVELLKAQACLSSNLRSAAVSAVIRAIHLAQSEHLVRIFITEGAAIEELIKEIAKEKLTKTSSALDAISKDYLDKLITAFEFEKKQAKGSLAEGLSSREVEVLKLLANKFSNNEISAELYISLSTVKTHISHILSKLGAKNRQEAAVIAIDKGII